MNKRLVNIAVCLGVAIALALGVFAVGCAPVPQGSLVGAQVDSDVYIEPGGNKLVVASGGEIEVQSGATLDAQSGSTFNMDGTISDDLTLENGESISNEYDGVITLTVPASGKVYVKNGGFQLDGTIVNSSGAVTVADGLIVSGAAGVDVSGGNITMQNDETLSNSYNGTISATVAAAGFLNVATGNLKVGDAAPTQALDGEDAYVEGGFEVDGTSVFDGVVYMNSSLDVGGSVASDIGAFTIADLDGLSLSGPIVNSSGAVTITDAALVDGGCLNIGGGTPTSCGDNDAYVTADFEVDGTLNADSTSDFADTATFSKASGTALAITTGGAFAPSGLINLGCSTYITTNAFLTVTTPCLVLASTTNPMSVTLMTSGVTTGTILYVVNEGTKDGIIIDTNLYASGGAAITLTQYDTVGLMYAWGGWRQLWAVLNNS